LGIFPNPKPLPPQRFTGEESRSRPPLTLEKLSYQCRRVHPGVVVPLFVKKKKEECGEQKRKGKEEEEVGEKMELCSREHRAVGVVAIHPYRCLREK
jgi:hypothetical protein